MKIIFLDIDGVLNGAAVKSKFLWYITYRLNLRKIYYFIEDLFNFREPYYSVHEDKVKMLSEIVNKTGALVVLTSSFRTTLYKDYIAYNNDPEHTVFVSDEIKKMVLLFKKYDIPILDIVPEKNKRRFVNIYQWLMDNKQKYDITNFIILDDEYEGLGFYYNYDFKYTRSIITSDSNIKRDISGRWYCREGIRKIHVRQAIKKLNSEPLNRYS